MNNKIYVAMTDKNMSGWGMAENKIAKYIIECDTWEQAEQIERVALKKPEMQYVNININKPYYSPAGYAVTVKHYNDLDGIWTGEIYRIDNEQEG